LERRYSSAPGIEVDVRQAEAFGRWAARRLPPADVLQAWTGYSLESIPIARSRGMTVIACRASTHIEVQASLVEEEFERFGLRTKVVSPRMVERELREYEAASYIQVMSTFGLNSFLAKGIPRSKMLFVPTASADFAEVGIRERPAPPPGPLRVLCLGHVSLRKGTRYLLEAARSLGRDTVTVSIVGGLAEEGQAVLDRYATEGQYRGKVPRSQLRDVLAAHDVLVVPSIEDGGPVTIVEGMAAGLAVISTTNTAAPDVITDGVTGFLIPAGDSAVIAERLAMLAADRERVREVGQAAQRSFTQNRTWAHAVAEMSAQYAALLGKKTEPRPAAASPRDALGGDRRVAPS
jgi:glycosyltransferase involved in cell wall biosynthesis